MSEQVQEAEFERQPAEQQHTLSPEELKELQQIDQNAVALKMQLANLTIAQSQAAAKAAQMDQIFQERLTMFASQRGIVLGGPQKWQVDLQSGKFAGKFVQGK